VTTTRLIAMTTLVLVMAAPAYAHDWNDQAIAWKGYEDGLAAAKKEKKPICLIVYTEWCPHCANYAKVFSDPKVVLQARKFVMIRLDQDKEKTLVAQFAPDGGYIPRTMFLTPDGKLDPDVHAPRDQYKFFYDEKDAASVLAGMDAALKKQGGGK